MSRYRVTSGGVEWTRPEDGRTFLVLCTECPSPAVNTWRDATGEHPRCPDHTPA